MNSNSNNNQPNIIAISNGKGGVGKTTLTVNMAALLAAQNHKTLVIDLDVQNNIARDFGFLDRIDHGKAFAKALMFREELQPFTNIRPNLDVLNGGDDLRKLTTYINSELITNNQNIIPNLVAHLKELCDLYDYVIIDTPAREITLLKIAYLMSEYIIIPTTGDSASNDGLAMVIQARESLSALNPKLSLLAVVLMAVPHKSTRLQNRMINDVAELIENKNLICTNLIRDAKSANYLSRTIGACTFELDEYLNNSPNQSPKLHQQIKTELNKVIKPQELPTNIHALAQDYKSLIDEIILKCKKG